MNPMHWFEAHFHATSQSALNAAHKYHVDPPTFLAIYVLHYLIVLPAFAWILVEFRRKRNVTNPVIVWILSMLIPWFYPLFFGRLPWFYDAGLVGVMVFIVWHGYHSLQKRLAAEKVRMGSKLPAEESA